MTESFWNGLLVVDKPAGLTSRDAVDRIQAQLPKRTKIGHTGTLDPLATGVLVVCIGQATRLAEYVQAMDKEYESRFRLGAVSDTDDADGNVEIRQVEPVLESALQEALRSFVGTMPQLPPAYSAAKVDGRRAYTMARAGEAVTLAPRNVRIDQIQVRNYEWPIVDVVVRCGKGTYIRSIARDLGQKLGCGGMVEQLRRTRVGPFRADDAVHVDASSEFIHERLRPMADALAALTRVDLGADDAARIRMGQCIPTETACNGSELALVGPENELVAVAVLDGRRLRPIKVIPSTIATAQKSPPAECPASTLAEIHSAEPNVASGEV